MDKPQRDPQARWQQEIEKWDQFYASLETQEESDEMHLFGEELQEAVSTFLPKGSRILEAGCGGGWQSLSLARSAKYQVSLLDFSREALLFAQKVFEQAQVKVDFILDNIIAASQPEFDLVFNAGVFEHYAFEEQVALLKGMAHRSRKYVMVIVPNRLCYWYWLWRINGTSRSMWPFGKEVPVADLSKLFEAAGIHFIGQSFMAANWTDSFVKLAPGLDDLFRQLILEVHHSPVIDAYQKSYLVAGLGCVFPEAQTELPGWRSTPIQESFDFAVLQSALADTIASKIHSEYQLTKSLEQARQACHLKEQEFLQSRQSLLEAGNELDHTRQELERSSQALSHLGNAVELLRTEYQTKLQTKEGQLQNRALELSRLQETLQNEISAWKNRSETHLAELTEIKSSRMWKVVHSVWYARQTLRRFGAGLNKRNPRGFGESAPALEKTAEKVAPTKTSFYAICAQKKAEYTSWLDNINNYEPATAQKVHTLIQAEAYKGIIVYPLAVHWEPLQRPQQLLIEFGRKGYLCFYCENHVPEFELTEVSENVYLVPGEKRLLFPLQDVQVIMLCTWMYQMPLVEALPNHLLWYDLIDKIDIFSLYDESMEEMHQQVVQIADFVTYSGLKLKEYLPGREDAVYLPNAARIEDFANAHDLPTPSTLAEIVARNKPIIGYYGALAEWVDLGLVRHLAKQHPEWDFVIIGKSWVDISAIKNMANIHYIGPVPYAELPALAQVFDVAFIPFVINELTDCVSPIKLFEFCALRLPIVTTPFYEVTQYQQPFIKFASTTDEFSQAIQECLTEEMRTAARVAAPVFAQQHQWSSRVTLVEMLFEHSLSGLKCFSNYLPHPYVAAMTGTFFNFDGREFYAGGAERYIIDLHVVLSKMGARMVTYQYGSFPWMRKYGSMDVLSIARQKGTPASYDHEAVLHFNRCFYQSHLSRSTLNIYSAFSENWPLALHPCVGISHGISWDYNLFDFNNGETFWDQNKRVIESFRACDAVVSVDTNTANWFQTIDYENAQKIRYLPNYVDLDEFHPRLDFTAAREKIVVLYPRRLYKPRGLYLLLAVIDEVLEACPQVEVHFVGRGFEKDTQHVVEKQKIWGERIKWYSLLPEEMPNAYRDADITLIPTLYSEGTSLSCLEAMASGNAVIATRVGGLPDLVINNHNGLLIEPQEQALKDAIIQLVNNPAQLAELKTKAAEVAKAFNKHNWEKRWMDILSQLLPQNSTSMPTHPPTRLIDIYLTSLEPKEFLFPLLSKLLQNDFLLYIRLPKEHEAIIPESFHRLQFLSWEEEIYTTPELVIADAEAASTLSQKAGYILTGDLSQDLSQILSAL